MAEATWTTQRSGARLLDGFEHFACHVPLIEALAAIVETASHDHQVLRGHDHGELTAIAVCAVRVLRYVRAIVRHGPEVTAVVVAARRRRWCRRPHELDPGR